MVFTLVTSITLDFRLTSKKILIILLVLFIFLLLASPFGKIYAADPANLTRFGIGWGYIPNNISNKDYKIYDPVGLGVGWYTDWGYTYAPKIAKDLADKGIQRLTLVLKDRNDYYSPQKCEDVKTYVADHPDAFNFKTTYWSVGNELGFDISNLTASKYASEFMNWRDCIKSINNRYKVGSGAIISLWTVHPRTFPSSCVNDLNDSKSGYSFLKSYINKIKNTDSSKLPDFMVMHAYYACTPPFAEDTTNFSKFKNHIISHRQAMKEFGLQNKELWIKEYNNYGYEKGGPAFVTDSIDYLMNTKDKEIGYPGDDYRLVQRFGWFILNNTPGTPNQWSQILASYADGSLTKYGVAFKKASQKYAGTRSVTPTPTPTVTPTDFPTPPPKPGNADNNGVVDNSDLAILIANFGRDGGVAVGNFNSDSIVDGVDYAIWFANYGK